LSSKRPEYTPPSPFTPFLRRFTDERARDLSETIELYDDVRAAYLASVWAKEGAIDRVSAHVAERVGEIVDLPNSQVLIRALDRCQQDILSLETTIFSSPQIDWDIATLSLKEQVDLRRFLRAQEYFLANDDRVKDLLTTALGNVFTGLIAALPTLPESADDSAFSVPLVSLIRDPGNIVDRIIGTILKDELARVGLFTTLQQQLYENVCYASHVIPGEQSRKRLITADESKLPPSELVETYLKNTPFLNLLLTPVPFTISDDSRFEHAVIFGGAGAGKTQFLSRLLMNDLLRPNPPSVIIIDPHGDFLKEIQNLQMFAPGQPLSDRLVILDPEQYSPALNMFNTQNTRLAGYESSIREQVEASTIETFAYIFAGLAQELTGPQATTFSYVARLMLSIDGATIHDLLDLMEDDPKSPDKSKFAEHISKMDRTSRAFFENQFFGKSLSPTKSGIARRLYGVLQVPAFNRMFGAQDNRLDMFDILQSGKICLVHTAKNLLKTDASSLFGRYIIAQVLHAAFERVAVPVNQRPPAYLLIDEAGEFCDPLFDNLLREVRKFRLGVTLAFQYVDQLPSSVRSSVFSNTAVKLASQVSDKDARALAPDMRTTHDFIASMKKGRRSTEFACYVRNHTDSAIRLEIPFGTLEANPKMTREQHANLIEHNRARYAASPAPLRAAVSGSDEPRPAVTAPEAPVRHSEKPGALRLEPIPPNAPAPDDDWRS